MNEMLVVTSGSVPGKRTTKALGLVRGSTIRARHLGNDIVAMLRNLVGGEITEYAELINRARDEAVSRMVRDAERLGANAIVDVRFSTTQVMSGAAEILAYGTGVVVQDED